VTDWLIDWDSTALLTHIGYIVPFISRPMLLLKIEINEKVDYVRVGNT